jgi:hypothetical protein
VAVVHVDELTVVVEMVDVLLDEVVVGVQPPLVQASQQLDSAETHAWPPEGARQAAILRLMEHFVAPAWVVRQHVIAPLRPQVERETQRRTTVAQAWFTSTASICAAAQCT